MVARYKTQITETKVEAIWGIRCCLSCYLRVVPSEGEPRRSLTGNLAPESPFPVSGPLGFFLPDLAVQISEETPADVMARNMRRHSSAGNVPGCRGLAEGRGSGRSRGGSLSCSCYEHLQFSPPAKAELAPASWVTVRCVIFGSFGSKRGLRRLGFFPGSGSS